ncbi:MAG: hypothetical protein H0T70_02225 [Acidimicrobiia bacterium]|nr:hypothetical protein [Acidimicrobiia bacterium]
MSEEQTPESLPKLVRGEELETEEGDEVPAQQTVSAQVAEGGGEWPDPHAPAQYPAPGAAEDGGGGD